MSIGDQAENLKDKIVSKAKETYGDVTDDRSLQVEGKVQQAKADARDAAQDAADEVRDRAESAKDEVVGRAKEAYGEATDNEILKAESRAQQS